MCTCMCMYASHLMRFVCCWQTAQAASSRMRLVRWLVRRARPATRITIRVRKRNRYFMKFFAVIFGLASPWPKFVIVLCSRPRRVVMLCVITQKLVFRNNVPVCSSIFCLISRFSCVNSWRHAATDRIHHNLFQRNTRQRQNFVDFFIFRRIFFFSFFPGADRVTKKAISPWKWSPRGGRAE